MGLLDRLMTLVGELVLARNQMLQFAATQQDAALQQVSQRLNLITSELQESVMKTRMQPIGNIWKALPRVARDVSLACGKTVHVELLGEETELDKTILEAIKDPLTHLVRNAIDHGIETTDVRQARGKPAAGRLLLRAFHEGGQVNLEIADDGGGIDSDRVKRKALERGLLTAERATHLGDRELLQLVFLPGFSTAEQVTTVSGRGVGMDVVKTNIERIGGTVDLQSRPGQGTSIKVKIPLTLAIIPALIVTSSGDRYAIPQVNLLELVRLEGDAARRGIERLHGTPVYRLRGNLLPLVHLDRALQVADGAESPGTEVVNIVVLQADDRPFGLVVDRINDTQEIVVKPLGPQLKGLPLFAGATIMGDGRVALILDVLGLAQRARVVPEGRSRPPADRPVAPAPAPDERQTLLLCELEAGRRVALPLSLVTRLEEVPRATVENASGQEVAQCRGRILPLVRLNRAIPGGTGLDDARTDMLQVVVCADQGRNVGLVVDRILDIVETVAEVQETGTAVGVRGATVIGGRVTGLLDVPAFFTRGSDGCP